MQRNDETPEESAENVSKLIANLGLSKASIHKRVRLPEPLVSARAAAQVGDSAVGTVLKRGLSGGEKRRTRRGGRARRAHPPAHTWMSHSIGVELVAAPDVLLLDEPTSGLDANAAYAAIKTIRDIVRRAARARYA